MLAGETSTESSILTFQIKSWLDIFDMRYLRHNITWTILLAIVYVAVLVVGVVGNSMVISVVILRPVMRTVTNIFILNLAVADILVIVFCVPSNLISNVFIRKFSFSILN